MISFTKVVFVKGEPGNQGSSYNPISLLCPVAKIKESRAPLHLRIPHYRPLATWFQTGTLHCHRPPPARAPDYDGAIHSGVPQGSVISLALFNHFISDIPVPIPNIASYADDLTIFVSSPSSTLRRLSSPCSFAAAQPLLHGTNWGFSKEEKEEKASLNYAAPIWYTVASRTVTASLQSIQNTALRLVTGCLKMAPIAHLPQETGVPPLSVHLDLAFSSRQGSDSAVCPENFADVGSGCVLAGDDFLTAEESQNFCRSHYGQLAVLSHCDIFSDAVNYVTGNGLNDSFWVGASYSTSRGAWQWRDGTLVGLGVPYWGQAEGGSVEPDSSYPTYCAALHTEGGFYFGDYACNAPVGIAPLCETPPSGDGVCDLPFVAVGSQCLHFAVDQYANFSFSRDLCQREGGDLVILKDCAQFRTVVDHIHQQGLEPSYGYWIGGGDPAENGDWRWLDGTAMALGVPYWGQYPGGELLPSNSTYERCLELDAERMHRFNDLPCTQLRRPLCSTPPLA
ncbi:uncharacterized protein LOC108677924 [Hyalella azteca]|uniref:Uncharacterized protein LOC108677924 n=1 Tax=Hyalella azteca TaxID=294128 RepID=A0A8B7P974_HYAAZ|nr:uncharacterized protein LOC108677924 [Hyalella azteca]